MIRILITLICLLIGSAVGAQTPPTFIVPGESIRTFAELETFARALAKKPFQPEPPLARELAELDYEKYIDIQFRHQDAVWHDKRHPFWLEFFHRGFVQQDRVEIFTLPRPGGAVGKIPYDAKKFRFGKKVGDLNVAADAGYAGLKVAGRFRPGGDAQELLTFLGSSYFRSRSADTVYGSSARGVAIDIGLNKNEEFPDFRAFWVAEPLRYDSTISILALLDGPSVTGAYQFTFDPGTTRSVLDVAATLWFRKSPEKIAYAPLTSMWMWGDGLIGPSQDARPSVHDADGCLFLDGDQWKWRPLARLPYPSVSTYRIEELKCFALMQRDRHFPHFRDTGARYHERPSVIVTPKQPWTDGRIELLEFPGAHEGVDNIGMYFVPNVFPTIDQPSHLEYSVAFASGQPPMMKETPGLFQVRDLVVDRSTANITLDITFEPSRLPVDGDVPAHIDLRTIRGEVVRSEITRKINQRHIVTLEIHPTEAAPIEIECQLLDSDNRAVSERFLYLCPHEQPKFVYPAVYTRQE